MALSLFVAFATCSLVSGLSHRTDASQLASQHGEESSRDVKLSVTTIAKLDALKVKLHLTKDDNYEDVVGWLLGDLGADGKLGGEKSLAAAAPEPGSRPRPEAVAMRLNSSATVDETAAKRQGGCLFDDQMFGMNPAMKAALQQELTAGPLSEAVQYVKAHPNEGWMHCAMKGQSCSCAGQVRFGESHWLGPSWSNPIAVASTVMCEPISFHPYTMTQPEAAATCQCAWDSEKLHQPSIQLRFNSWSYAQEAWIFMLRTLAQAKWLPWSGDRNLHGSTLFAARGGGIFDRVWINKWLDTVGKEYVAKYFGTKSLNCLEWDPIFYSKKFPSCAQAGYNLWYVPEAEKMRVEGKTIYADILKLPQVAGTLKMDLVVATQVWEHLNQPVASVKALYEAMNPGGVLLFAVPFKAPFHGAPEDYWRYTKSGVVQVLEQGGFCVPRSAMASGGDFIYSIGLNAGISAGDFSQEELLKAYFRGFDSIPDGPLEIFAVGLKKKLPTDACPP